MNGLFVFLILLALGYIFGRLAERRHLKSIERREKLTVNLPVVNLKTIPRNLSNCRTRLVSGNVVVSINYYKKVLSALRSIFGGSLKSYESLLDRAR